MKIPTNKIEAIEWIEWVDPVNKACDPVFCRVTPEVAIACSKEAATIRGHVYENDSDALEDFIITNWAWIIPEYWSFNAVRKRSIAALKRLFFKQKPSKMESV